MKSRPGGIRIGWCNSSPLHPVMPLCSTPYFPLTAPAARSMRLYLKVSSTGMRTSSFAAGLPIVGKYTSMPIFSSTSMPPQPGGVNSILLLCSGLKTSNCAGPSHAGMAARPSCGSAAAGRYHPHIYDYRRRKNNAHYPSGNGTPTGSCRA